jgi:hypothetical protein
MTQMIVSWIVQSNLGTDKIHLTIKDACHKLGLSCSFVERIPFSKELPDVPTDVPTIFYGSTRFVNTIFTSKKWSPAAFFDPDTFLATVWGPAYGEHWLNQGAKFTTLGEFIWEPHLSDRLFFVRPVRDLKEFNGGIWSFGQLRRWNSGLLKTDLGSEQLNDIPILVSDPWGISREWRLFMVDGKVSSASQYKLKDTLFLDANVPQEVLTFGEQMAKIFSPHKIFILDICESAGNLYVLEVGCINSAGFYAANVKKIVEDISSQT